MTTGHHPDLPYEVDVKWSCSLCWEQFDSPVALLEHEALEDDRLYFVDGLVDEDYAPSKNAETT